MINEKREMTTTNVEIAEILNKFFASVFKGFSCVSCP